MNNYLGALFTILAVSINGHAVAATLEGTVLNSVTRLPLSGVSVTVTSGQLPSGRTEEHRAITNSLGKFRVEGVLGSQYSVTYKLDRFTMERMHQSVIVPDEKGTVQIEGQLIPLASLQGVVRDPNGEPLPNVDVEAIRTDFAGLNVARTRTDGAFEFETLVPGRYFLLARPNVLPLLGIEKVPVTNPVSNDAVAIATYYPSAAILSHAVPVQLSPGEGASGYIIQLDRQPLHQIHGKVTDAFGKVVRGATVRLFRPEGPNRAEALAQSDDTGHFTLSAWDGDWICAATYGAGPSELRAYVRVRVAKLDQEVVPLRLLTSSIIRGKVISSTPRLAAECQPSVPLLPMGGNPWAPLRSQLEPDGNFLIPGLYDGEYQVKASTTVKTHYVESLVAGAEDVLGRLVFLNGGSTPLIVRCEAGAGEISGILSSNGGSVGSPLVLLVPEGQNAGGTHTHIIWAASDGTFAKAGLRPGAYYVAAARSSTSTTIDTTTLISGVLARGMRIEVRSGVTSHLKLESFVD